MDQKSSVCSRFLSFTHVGAQDLCASMQHVGCSTGLGCITVTHFKSSMDEETYSPLTLLSKPAATEIDVCDPITVCARDPDR